ncbi:sine oculis-binding protein homolog [Littorina saxatilis]|uniref:sine oculis-binding protein homolog n=1 Tax=Littorina saxatilis TaxID=31220 RepID=UPI0038B5CE2F
MEATESQGGGGREEAPPPSASEGKRASSVPTQPMALRIKQEPKDDIKDFAETTMNELLGWYGYTDKVDQQDTAQLSLTSYRPSSTSPRRRKERADPDDDDNHSDDNANREKKEGEEEEAREAGTPDSGDSEQDTGRLSVDSSETRLAAQHRSLVKALSNSKAANNGESEGGEEGSPPQRIICAWCQKTGLKLFTLKTATGSKVFCSEVCFTQCRRASFKKNKVCDWCKHVRHTVNFVDFQDGETQLQFCSEKCLGQYKMNIFCTETQEHLKQIQNQLHEERHQGALSPAGASSSPSSLTSKGLTDAACASSAPRSKPEDQILITPDLWLPPLRHTLPKLEVLDVDEGEGRGKREGEREGRREVREARSESVSSERGGSRDLPIDRKRVTLPSSAAGAAAAAAVVASYASSLHLGKGGGGRLARGMERSARDRERSRRLFRDSRGDRDSHLLPHPTDSPAPSTNPHASDKSTPPMLPPMLLPGLNGLGAGLSMFNPLLYSSLFGPLPGDAHRPDGQPRHQPAHSERKEEGGSRARARSGDRASTSSTPGGAHSSASPANTASSSGTPNPPPHLPPHQLPPPPTFSAGVTALNGPSSLPPGMHPPPLMLGVPPFACPPGFFPPDPAAFMSSLLALQGQHPPPPPPLHHHHHQQQQHHHQQQQQQNQRDRTQQPGPRGEDQVPMSATAGSLSGGVPPVTVMMPFPVLLPLPIPIPFPIPVAPERIQQFFKEREMASSTAQPTPPPPPPPSVSRTSLSSLSAERHASRSHSPAQDKNSPTSQRSSLLNHSYRHHQRQRQHYKQQAERRPDSVSSDSSCHSPSLAGQHGPAPCHDGHSPGCVTCVSGHAPFPASRRESLDSIMALRKTRESADSIMTLRRENARSFMSADAVSPSPSLPLSLPQSLSPVKRSLTPVLPLPLPLPLSLSPARRSVTPVSLDLSRRRVEDRRHTEDEAIDLSKDSRSSTPAPSPKDFSLRAPHPALLTNGLSCCSSSSNHSSAASGKENLEAEHDVSSLDLEHDGDHDMASVDGESQSGPSVPKIHIIDSHHDPPLAAPLPLPPADHAYSMRRSLILDAPSIPKRPRSPSPERRYVRTVPRDMVEAAKRRCLRARVRTK